MPTRQIEITTAILAIALSVPVPSLMAQSRRTVKGNLHPKAQSQFDRGPVHPGTRLAYVSLLLRRSDSQQQALDDLLAAQQDGNSPLYHRWLTPEQYAERFGASQADIDKAVNWLQSSGFSVKRVARGRDVVVFGGTAGQIQKALGTAIHAYDVGGRRHYANVEEPSVPEELAGAIAGFRGLNDFRLMAPQRRSVFPPTRITGRPFTADFYSKAYPNTNVLAPDDLATIYNINALYKAGIDGSGQVIAVAGATDIDMADIEYFRSAFGLPLNNPFKILVPDSPDPGILESDLGEADLDLEWSGAIAPQATILYVYSDDVVSSAFWAIDEAIAPVLSFSYGACELEISKSDAKALAAEAQRAAAQGITWVVSSGDSGAAGCENQNGGYTSATTRMSVNLPAGVPYVTAVGGSEFNESSGNYWASKLRSNGGSALSYIPEGAWTDEALVAKNGDSGFAATGGGASLYFAKPSWQTGPGVPNDGARDVPDVSLNASWYHDPYAMITGGMFVPNGGTSAAAPSFAGIVALLNQYLKTNGLGNINPKLYQLAQSAPSAFHDITSGSNIVPCETHSTQDCRNGSMGYSAHVGYDQVTGLGSVDAFNLARSWKGGAQSPHLVVTKLTASTTIAAGGAFDMAFTVANQGTADAGAFEMRVYLTANGDVSTANDWSVYCNVPGLAVGAFWNCNGTLSLGKSVTPGIYYVLGVADAKNSVQQADHSGGAALASTGSLTVTK